MLQIVLATGNKHKVEEINQVSVPFGVEFVLPDEGFNPIEDGSTFEENSYAKALAAAQCEKSGRKYFMAAQGTHQAPMSALKNFYVH